MTAGEIGASGGFPPRKRRWPRGGLAWAAGVPAAAAGGFAGGAVFNRDAPDTASLRKELETLKASHAALERLADRIQESVPSPPAVREVILRIEDAPFKGRADARLTLVEFSDYECGFCARHVRETMPQIEREYVATGMLKYVFRHYPIEAIHADAFKAHEAALCAGAQGRFWDMHALLFAGQSALAPSQLSGYAQALGLNTPLFEQCLSGGTSGSLIRRDLAEGLEAGVTGPPAFFLGVATSDGAGVRVLGRTVGAKPYAAFKKAIDALLMRPEANGPVRGR